MTLAPATAEWLARLSGDEQPLHLLDIWRESLALPGFDDPLMSALAELSAYYHIPIDEVRMRCENWEQESIEEWERANRDTPDGLLDFYRTTESWTFDTVWYHAKQCSGEQFPESVAIAHALRGMRPGHMLDLGAGPGSTALFFHRLGWQVSLADISSSMQAFAKWRFAQRAIPATFCDTSRDNLPLDTFDLITAIDVVAHIPNWERELVRIHAALKRGGLFIFNVDARSKARETQWHLYQFHYPILRPMRRAGFRRESGIEFFYVYRKDGRRTGTAYAADTMVDMLRYNRCISFGGQLYRALRHSRVLRCAVLAD